MLFIISCSISYENYHMSMKKYVTLKYVTLFKGKIPFLRLLYSSLNEVCSYFEYNFLILLWNLCFVFVNGELLFSFFFLLLVCVFVRVFAFECVCVLCACRVPTLASFPHGSPVCLLRKGAHWTEGELSLKCTLSNWQKYNSLLLTVVSTLLSGILNLTLHISGFLFSKHIVLISRYKALQRGGSYVRLGNKWTLYALLDIPHCLLRSWLLYCFNLICKWIWNIGHYMSIWKGFEGEKKRGKWYNYIITSKEKFKGTNPWVPEPWVLKLCIGVSLMSGG